MLFAGELRFTSLGALCRFDILIEDAAFFIATQQAFHAIWQVYDVRTHIVRRERVASHHPAVVVPGADFLLCWLAINKVGRRTGVVRGLCTTRPAQEHQDAYKSKKMTLAHSHVLQHTVLPRGSASADLMSLDPSSYKAAVFFP